MIQGNEEIVRVLEEAGVEYVFGIPGGGTMAIYEALYGSPIRTLLVRHEQTAAIMADAYGRATGKPAVVLGQGLFIASNASFGIMEAYLSSSPMLILTDTSDGNMAQLPSNQSGAGEYGSIDLPAMFRAMTKYTTVATTGKEAVLGTQLALKHALTGRPGPAAVVLRSAAIVTEANPDKAPRRRPTAGYLHLARGQAPPPQIEAACDLLLSAARPVLVAGHGARLSGATGRLLELAEKLAMPVATSYKGKSAIPETHPLALGMVGIFGSAAANQMVGEADVILVVGALLRVQETLREKPTVWDPDRQRIIQIDIDPYNAGWALPVQQALIGDADAVLSQLLAALEARSLDSSRIGKRRAAILERKAQLHYFAAPSLFVDSSPVQPQRLVRLLHEHLAEDSLITLDAGNNRLWMSLFYQTRMANSLFAPGGTAGMAWALPAALGLKLVYPNHPVVCVAGDGGFMMSIQALATAVQHHLPVTCVVMNDSALGMVRQHQGKRVIASEFPRQDYAALARGFGVSGIRVEDSRDLPAALIQAQRSGATTVIDVVIDPDPAPDDYRAIPRGPTET